MRLLRLHLQGFKSFKDRTTIHFDKGITGIVGPNGCGKSNIVDALFWVMGEQSAKHLRGKKMNDLIFAGSDKYKPATFAEVTLVLANDNLKPIHINDQVCKPSEIQITRKLYSNSETEYRLNSQPCRLKDIHEVFMDTGAGAKSYSIIAQGEINRLVQSKPEERRVMIEEVAGITKFKLRKKESLKKIEKTQENLSRLEDLRVEVNKQLKNLEKQSEKAARARDLKEKVKRHDLNVESNKEHDYLVEFISIEDRFKQVTESRDHLLTLKKELEISLQEEQRQKEELKEDLEIKEKSYMEGAKKLATYEEKNKSLEHYIVDKETRVESLKQELEELEGLIAQRSLKLEELQNSFTTFSLGKVSEETTQEALLLKDEKEKNYLESRDSFKNADELKKSLNQELEEVEKNLFKLSHQRDELSLKIQNSIEEIESQEKTQSEIFENALNEKNKFLSLNDIYENALANYESLESKKKDIQLTLLDIEKEERLQSKNIMTLENEIKVNEVLLSQLQAQNSAIDFTQNHSSLYQVVSSLIEVEDRYIKPVEIMLGHYFSQIISLDKNYSDAEKWLEDHRAGLQFLKIDDDFNVSEEVLDRIKIYGVKSLIPLSEIVRIKNQDFNLILNALLQGFYIAEGLDFNISKKIPSAINIRGLIDESGTHQVSFSQGIKTYAHQIKDSGSVSLLEIQKDLTQKRNELGVLSDLYEKTLTELEAIKKTEAQIQDDFINAREHFTQINSEYIHLKSSVEAKTHFSSDNQSKINRLLEHKNNLSTEKLKVLEDEEKLQLKKNEIVDKITHFMQTNLDLENALKKSEEEFQAARDKYQELKIIFDSYDEQRKMYQSQIADQEMEKSRNVDKLEKNKSLIENYQLELAELLDQQDEIAKDLASFRQEAKIFEEEYSQIKDSYSMLGDQMRGRENDLQKMVASINGLEKEEVKLASQKERIIEEEEFTVRNAFEKYQVNLRQCLMSFLQVESVGGLKDISSFIQLGKEENSFVIETNDYEFVKKFPGQINESKEKRRRYQAELNQLGEINWQAIEDYERQEKRHNFLVEQQAEIQKSLADLLLAINQIDEKSKSRFEEAFNDVNERFSKVFPIIFGGGSAELKIVGDLNDPECGIDIIAQPPGKKMQNINLMSGGEKAMTAVSLIFSIFLVKPSPFCLLDEVDAPLDDANVGRFNALLREMSLDSQFILITHNKKTMEMNDTLYGVTMQEPGVSKAVSIQLQ